MANILDLKGLSCPIPLIETKNALAQTDKLTVIVDDAAAKENISKFTKYQNYNFECVKNKEDYVITITKQ